MELLILLVLLFVLAIFGYYGICHIIKLYCGCDFEGAVTKLNNFINGKAVYTINNDASFIAAIEDNVKNVIGEKRYAQLTQLAQSAIGAPLLTFGSETPLCKEMWNEYHWGASGTGKTYTYINLCEKHGEDNVYICNDYSNSGGSGGGFDMYTNNPAKYIVLDEFRGNMPYNTLLSLLDKYSRNQQHCRYQNTYNLWTSVYICSVLPPEKVYDFMVDKAVQTIDSKRQFFRRLNKIVYHYKNDKGEFCEFAMSADEYKNAEDMILQAKISENAALIEDSNRGVIKECEKNEMLKAFGARQIERLIMMN